MKKLLVILIISLFSNNISLADIKLSCEMTNWNENESLGEEMGEIKYTNLQPSSFSAIIEITSPGKVIARLIGSSDTGNMLSPFVGTIDDSRVLMNNKISKLKERGTDFRLDLISGRFQMNSYIGDYKYWWLQKTGICRKVN
jgi:hypothetical protein